MATGVSSTPLMRLKIAVFAPMPRASVETAVRTKPGFLLRLRTANRTSWTKRSMMLNLRTSRQCSFTCSIPPNSSRTCRRASCSGRPEV